MEQYEIVAKLKGIKSIIAAFANTDEKSIIQDMDFGFMIVVQELEDIIKQFS